MGSMKSTHNMSLEVMSGVMPLKLRFLYLSLRLLIRFTVSNPLVIENFKSLLEAQSKSKIMDLYHDFVSLQAHPSSITTSDSVALPETYSSLLSVDSSMTEETRNVPDSLRWMIIPSIFMDTYGHLDSHKQYFTDGSSSEKGTGFGIHSTTTEAFYKLRLPCTIYIAELAAIFFALLLISARPPDEYFIFTDSLSAVEALKTVKAVKSPDYFTKKIIEVLSSLFHKAFRISLIWIPSHAGISGNEKADELAKKGASEGDFYERPILCHEYVRTPLEFCLARWQSLWDADDLGRFLYSITPKVTLRPWFDGLVEGRAFIRMMSRLMSNHYALGAHLQRINLVPTKACCCSVGFHDIDHLLWSCTEYEPVRGSLFAAVDAIEGERGIPIRDILATKDLQYMKIIFKFARDHGLDL